MYLALLGFGMIVVFMALIMAKKLSPFTSLILIPIVFGLLAGYGWDTLEYAANGIINVASTFAMMTFAILYFGVMLTAGMSNAIAEFLVSIIPESLGNYFAVIIAIISAPGTYLLNNDAFYYGVLPPLAATAQAYGFTDLQIGFAALMGQAFHFLSPLVPFIYLLMDKTEITLAQYQGYIFKWCIGIFVIFMAMGFVTGSLAIL